MVDRVGEIKQRAAKGEAYLEDIDWLVKENERLTKALVAYEAAIGAHRACRGAQGDGFDACDKTLWALREALGRGGDT